jgi:hypothetical protein
MIKIKNFQIFDTNFRFLKKNNIVILRNLLGFLKIRMSSYFYFKSEANKFYFLFVNKKLYKKFLMNFLFFFNVYFRFFFFKLKLRGLGYRIKKFTKNLYRFFFAFNHYFYFHISKDLFVKHRKRNLIIFSNNLAKLNDVFSHLLILKKLDFYERNNTFIISKKILFFKKRK